MTEEEKLKLIDIRQRGKTGRPVTDEEHKFCDQMIKKYPAAYHKIDEYIRQWAQFYVNPFSTEPEVPDV